MLRVNGRRLVGILVIISAAGLALGREYVIRRDLAFAAAIESRPEVSADTALRASIEYHAAHAEAVARARWSLIGHGTLGVVGVIVGIAILIDARRRDRG